MVSKRTKESNSLDDVGIQKTTLQISPQLSMVLIGLLAILMPFAAGAIVAWSPNVLNDRLQFVAEVIVAGEIATLMLAASAYFQISKATGFLGQLTSRVRKGLQDRSFDIAANDYR